MEEFAEFSWLGNKRMMIEHGISFKVDIVVFKSVVVLYG